MKCPICNDGKIITNLDGTYECDNPECSIYDGTHTETFEALIRTRKALDVAMKGLYDVFTTRPNGCTLNSMKAKETMDKVKRLVGANNTSVSSPA